RTTTSPRSASAPSSSTASSPTRGDRAARGSERRSDLWGRVSGFPPGCAVLSPDVTGGPGRVTATRRPALCTRRMPRGRLEGMDQGGSRLNQLAPAILALSLLACGGSAPPPDSPGGSGGAEPASASAGDEPAAPAGGGGGEEGGGAAGGGGEGENVFQLRDSSTAADARGEQPSKIKPTQTEAALRFFVVDKQDGPIKGIVISLTSPAGDKFYTEETDGKGYAEVLVPIGQTYELTYLSLGRRDVTAKVTVKDEPNQNIKLTLRYKRDDYMPSSVRRFVLKDVHFETGKATLTPGSFARLDQVVEFMTYK